MECPKCNQPKTKEDFYWRKHTFTNNPIKVRRECKECLAKEYELKQQEQTSSKFFNLKDFFKHYAY